MSARKGLTRHASEVLRERNALIKCVERMAAELQRLEANGADEAISEDGLNVVRWCRVRANARMRDLRAASAA